jgi:antitoxin PrlF
VVARAKVTSKGQVTLPRAVRERHGIKVGDTIEFVEQGGKTWMRARNLRAIDLLGILGPPPNGVQFTDEELDRAINDAAAEQAAEEDERIARQSRDSRK